MVVMGQVWRQGFVKIWQKLKICRFFKKMDNRIQEYPRYSEDEALGT